MQMDQLLAFLPLCVSSCGLHSRFADYWEAAPNNRHTWVKALPGVVIFLVSWLASAVATNSSGKVL